MGKVIQFPSRSVSAHGGAFRRAAEALRSSVAEAEDNLLRARLALRIYERLADLAAGRSPERSTSDREQLLAWAATLPDSPRKLLLLRAADRAAQNTSSPGPGDPGLLPEGERKR